MPWFMIFFVYPPNKLNSNVLMFHSFEICLYCNYNKQSATKHNVVYIALKIKSNVFTYGTRFD